MAKKRTEKKTSTKKTEAKGKVSSTRKGPKTAAQAKKDAPDTAVAESMAGPASAAPTPAAPPTPDARLPALGTVIQKKDRHGAVRCECMVEEGGIRYAGKIYRSLSAAAMAAAKDLGLVNKTQNGWNFWGITKAPRRPSDPLVALDRAWERYHGNVEALVKEGVTDENRSKVIAAIRKHAEVIETLREKVA